MDYSGLKEKKSRAVLQSEVVQVAIYSSDFLSGETHYAYSTLTA